MRHDRDLDYDRDVFADDVRAFFGELPESAGPSMPPREHTPRRGTIEQLRQWRVEEGLCARASCSGTLDAGGCCGFCGWSLTEERMRDRLQAKDSPADRPDYLPRLPGALLIDDEDAAA